MQSVGQQDGLDGSQEAILLTNISDEEFKRATIQSAGTRAGR